MSRIVAADSLMLIVIKLCPFAIIVAESLDYPGILCDLLCAVRITEVLVAYAACPVRAVSGFLTCCSICFSLYPCMSCCLDRFSLGCSTNCTCVSHYTFFCTCCCRCYLAIIPAVSIILYMIGIISTNSLMLSLVIRLPVAIIVACCKSINFLHVTSCSSVKSLVGSN